MVLYRRKEEEIDERVPRLWSMGKKRVSPCLVRSFVSFFFFPFGWRAFLEMLPHVHFFTVDYIKEASS